MTKLKANAVNLSVMQMKAAIYGLLGEMMGGMEVVPTAIPQPEIVTRRKVVKALLKMLSHQIILDILTIFPPPSDRSGMIDK